MILDLCGGTGSWSAPYERAGYHVLIVDPIRNWTVEQFIFMLRSGKVLKEPVEGVLAAPPCTEFSSAGAKHWEIKDAQLLDNAVATVRACHDVVQFVKPKWWALENPVGRLAECCPFLGPWKMTFQPWEYGDPWSKKTCLWGDFTIPPKLYNTKSATTIKGRIHTMSENKTRAMLRSITPPRFADAFFRSNP